ncbi:hypothetical protein LINPERHAP2_LOCUS16862, partial [Linum perenne]
CIFSVSLLLLCCRLIGEGSRFQRGTAPKGLKSWIHHFGGDTSFFKKFNPAQRKTLGLVKDFNPAQPNSSTLVPTLFLYVFSEPDYQTIIVVNVTRE